MARRVHLIVAAVVLLSMAVAVLPSPAAAPAGNTWRAGVGRVVITPEQPMWMSGYAGRDHPAEGALHDLWAKALALEDADGRRALIITMDLVGIDRDLSRAVRDAIGKQFGLKYEQIALCTSHTHSGPVVGRNLTSMYFYDEAQAKRVDDYTAALRDKLIKLAGQAIDDLSPCRLSRGSGTATYAVNRRNNPESQVPQLRAEGKIKGPFDHDVPVLKVTAADGTLKAVLFGYACHATTLSGYQWCGDHPGYAQADLEKAHRGATALFFAGCGGDQNPLPRRKVELAQQYGKELAAAVDAVLGADMQRVAPVLATSYSEIDLPFNALPNRDELQEQTQSTNRYVASRARHLLAQVDGGKPLSPTYPYPVQVWRLGGDLCFVLLGGEVVVDYALRLKRELGAGRTWVAGYSNDVMAYIPSLRVLKEGGYEGGGAMVYYGLPSPWAPPVEDLIVKQVHQQAQQVGVNR